LSGRKQPEAILFQMGSTFGKIFQVTTFGESHGESIGCVIDGCPANIPIDLSHIDRELQRRKPGQSDITTPRKENDSFTIQSGLFDGKTLGTPIAILIPNKDADPSAYKPFADQFRPSHADYTYQEKYGIRDWRGGGRASARETASRVAAGAIAKQILTHLHGIEIVAWVKQIGDISCTTDLSLVTKEQVECNVIRCPDEQIAKEMEVLIRKVKAEKDTLGGVISCVCRNVPSGLGEPVFDKLEAELAKAMLSIPACKGFDIGSGFAGTQMRGSQHNDPFINKDGQIQTSTNFSGGIQGGISNGMPIYFSVAFKPVSTIFQSQQTVNIKQQEVSIDPRGRHDPCVLPRAVPIVEAMAALTILDQVLRQHRQTVGNDIKNV
jgi:chorismate synthase